MHEKFKALLEENYVWPAEFHFKFIVPTEQIEALKALLNTDKIELRPSRNQTYTSVNAWMKLASSDEVVYVYEKVKDIKGLIAL
ncbi:MAG: DUF493 family protein [Candidatus Sericytochromatia bacterium]|nr:DUF493 family protein [Candidatus Sericytochromatia bacterium]